MGIRDTSYYGWKTIDTYGSDTSIGSASYYDLVVDSSGSIYACGFQKSKNNLTSSWFVRKSSNNGLTWLTVIADDPTVVNATIGNLLIANAISVDSNDNIFLTVNPDANYYVMKSSDRGITWSISYDGGVDNGGGIYSSDIAVSSSNTIYAAFRDALSFEPRIVRSINGGSTWSNLAPSAISDMTRPVSIRSPNNGKIYASFSGSLFSSSDAGANWFKNSGASAIVMYGLARNSSGNLYMVGTDAGFTGFDNVGDILIIASSSTNESIWGSSSYGTSSYIARDIAIDSKDSVYVVGSYTIDSVEKWLVMRSPNMNSPFTTIDTFNNGKATNIYVDTKDNIYVVGQQDAKRAIIRKGYLTANSASLGPIMLNTSFGYVYEEISGSTLERFKLNNISEFPHSNAIGQMPKLVIGTKSSGKIGSSPDSLIQVKHFGSFVRVVWPKQSEDVFVKGFGDLAKGQSPGKLSTDWQPGEIYNVEEFDSVALYGYALKETSGSLDDILIRVERRPIRDTAFATEKMVENTISSSYAAESIYREHIHRLPVDYGDLSIKEITWPIDIELTAMKELRISARQKNGQSDDKNKNLIVWARFIKASKDTNET